MSDLTLLNRQRVWLADLVRAFDWDSEQLFKDMLAAQDGRPTRPHSLLVRLALYSQHYMRIFREAVSLESREARLARGRLGEEIGQAGAEFRTAVDRLGRSLADEERVYLADVNAFGYAASDMGALFAKYARILNVLIDIPATRTAIVEGFNVRVVVDLPPGAAQELVNRGVDINRELNEIFGRVRFALRKYRERTQAAMPWLLHNALPLDIVIADPTKDGSIVEGRYLHGHAIQLFLLGNNHEDPATFVVTIAHEMGHHIWRSRMSAAQHDAWAETRGLTTTLALRDLLGRWRREVERDPDANVFENFVAKLAVSDDPRDHDLAVQLKVVVDRIGDHEKIHVLPNYTALVLAMARGEKLATVVDQPITVYAETNAEEAFCEAFGLLMAYGPRRVPADVARAMERVLPEFKFRQARPLRGV